MISGLPRNSSWSAGRGGRLERLVAERFEDVVVAFEQLARERDARAVAADAFGELEVVLPVGAVREAGALRGFIQRPAQRGRALAGEVAGRAVLVGLVDGDVEPALAAIP